MIDNKFTAEPWIGTKEIAEHLGVTVVTVRKWIVSGKVPCHRVGKLWRFKVSEIDAWVLSGGAIINEKNLQKNKLEKRI